MVSLRFRSSTKPRTKPPFASFERDNPANGTVTVSLNFYGSCPVSFGFVRPFVQVSFDFCAVSLVSFISGPKNAAENPNSSLEIFRHSLSFLALHFTTRERVFLQRLFRAYLHPSPVMFRCTRCFLPLKSLFFDVAQTSSEAMT